MMQVAISNLVTNISKWNPKKDLLDADFVYIDISSIDREKKTIEGTSIYMGADAPSRARQLVKEGDILVSTVRPNLNAVAFVGDEFDNATASTGYCVLRPKPNELDSRFLFHWVRTERFVDDLVRQATGASYPAVSDKIIKASKIPLPPLAEQRRIAAILDQADVLRQKRTRALARLDDLLQSVFLDMFGDVSSRKNLYLMNDLAVQIKHSFGNGPFGSDLLSSELTDAGVPVVYIRDITTGEYKRKSKVHVTHQKAEQLISCKVKPQDVLIAKVGTPPGTAAIYPVNEPEAIIVACQR